MKADDPRIQQFLERLQGLSTGERARLKRNAGKALADSHQVMGLFFKILPPGLWSGAEPWFFLVATLFPQTGSAAEGNFGDSLRLARSADNGDGLDRRFEVLLDADEQQLPFRLRQAVRLLAATEIPVNWPQLLSDLTNWTHPNRFVQEQWARTYFRRKES